MKKIITLIALLSITAYANAEVVMGVGYTRLSDSGINLSAMTVSAGYRINMQGNFSLTPEVRTGWGIGDDTYYGANVTVDSLYGFNLRGQWDFDNNLYLYLAPSYSTIKITASAGSFSASGSDSKFGGGGGLGYRFSKNLSLEGAYETFDGTDVYSVGLRFYFNQ